MPDTTRRSTLFIAGHDAITPVMVQGLPELDDLASINLAAGDATHTGTQHIALCQTDDRSSACLNQGSR